MAGFLGIALGFFIHFLVLSSQNSFGIPFFTPYIPYYNLSTNQGIHLNPVWGREKRDSYLNTKKPDLEKTISMKWRQHGK